MYGHTGTDVFVIAERVEALSRAHPLGAAMPIQVFSRENLWPLPWYLRRMTRVGYWGRAAEAGRLDAAPVLTVNSAHLNFVDAPADFDLLIERIIGMRGTREFFSMGE